MSPMKSTPRITYRRVLNGVLAFVIASLIFMAAGMEMQSYLLGVVAGVAAVALPAGALLWRRRSGSGD